MSISLLCKFWKRTHQLIRMVQTGKDVKMEARLVNSFIIIVFLCFYELAERLLMELKWITLLSANVQTIGKGTTARFCPQSLLY